MINDQLEERDDRYVLPLWGRSVSRCFVDYGFGLCFYVDGPSTEIRIEGKMRLLKNGHQQALVDPGPGAGPDPRTLGPLLILFGKTVISAHAFKNGELRILFEDDLILEVDPGEKYEPWEVSASNGLKLVSTPGGNLSSWKPLDS
jgi:hypothetical protein